MVLDSLRGSNRQWRIHCSGWH